MLAEPRGFLPGRRRDTVVTSRRRYREKQKIRTGGDDHDRFHRAGRRLGIILSSGNRTLEPYFRAYAPADLGIHVTRMRMGSGGKRGRGDIEAAALDCAELLADAYMDAIDLQGTGIMMERGPDGEAELVKRIADATGTPVYTATQSVVEALKSLGVKRVAVVNPGDAAAVGRERAYLDAVGIEITDARARDCGEATFEVTPEAMGGRRPSRGQRQGRRHLPERLAHPHGRGHSHDRGRHRQAGRDLDPGRTMGGAEKTRP